MTLTERLFSYVEKTDTCWEWKGRTISGGYGALMREYRKILAHRAAFELAFGPIPDGMLVLHACDNPSCVRNDDEGTYELNGILHPRRGHLWLGSHQDNTDDMLAKGRGPITMHGCERNGNARLRAEQVLAIRSRYVDGGITQYELAREYGVAQRTICDILRHVSWRDI